MMRARAHMVGIFGQQARCRTSTFTFADVRLWRGAESPARSCAVKDGRFIGVHHQPAPPPRRTVLRVRSMIFKWPLVTGSKLPGQMAMRMTHALLFCELQSAQNSASCLVARQRHRAVFVLLFQASACRMRSGRGAPRSVSASTVAARRQSRRATAGRMRGYGTADGTAGPAAQDRTVSRHAARYISAAVCRHAGFFKQAARPSAFCAHHRTGLPAAVDKHTATQRRG